MRENKLSGDNQPLRPTTTAAAEHSVRYQILVISMKWLFIPLLILCVFACNPQTKNAKSSSSDSEPQDLVFLGTVTNIKISSLPDPNLYWIVDTKVDKIISGSFSGNSFSFGIHSPTKSGLEVGKQYKIEAVWTGSGYSVDQYQWIKSGYQ